MAELLETFGLSSTSAIPRMRIQPIFRVQPLSPFGEDLLRPPSPLATGVELRRDLLHRHALRVHQEDVQRRAFLEGFETLCSRRAVQVAQILRTQIELLRELPNITCPQRSLADDLADAPCPRRVAQADRSVVKRRLPSRLCIPQALVLHGSRLKIIANLDCGSVRPIEAIDVALAEPRPFPRLQ